MANTNLAAKGKTLNKKSLSLIEIPLLSLGQQREVLDHLQTFDELDALLDEQIIVTKQLRQSLLSDLLSGSSLILESFDQFEEPI